MKCQLSCHHRVPKCGAWLGALLSEAPKLFRSVGSVRLQVWGPGVTLRPFFPQLTPRAAGPEADSHCQVSERDSCCSSCLGLAANHIWEWPPHTPVITRVALKQLAAVLFAHAGGGFLELPSLAGLRLTAVPLQATQCRRARGQHGGSQRRPPYRTWGRGRAPRG